MKYYYTYLIKCIPLNLCYYGVRSSKLPPKDDLWQKYFTSSNKVKQLIEDYGKDSFLYEIRREFKTLTESVNWEERVLRRLKIKNKKSIWLNRNISGAIFHDEESCLKQSEYMKANNPMHRIIFTDEMRSKRSASKLGDKNPMYGRVYTEEERRAKSVQMTGKKHSQEVKNVLREKALGRKHSDETKKLLSKTRKGTVAWAKKWEVTFPDNSKQIIENLNHFANLYNLNKSCLRAVAYGKQLQHKGFKVQKI